MRTNVNLDSQPTSSHSAQTVILRRVCSIIALFSLILTGCSKSSDESSSETPLAEAAGGSAVEGTMDRSVASPAMADPATAVPTDTDVPAATPGLMANDSPQPISQEETLELKRQFQARAESERDQLRSRFNSLEPLVGRVDDFASELGTLSKSFPSVAFSKQLRRAAIEAPIWRHSIRWIEFEKQLVKDLNGGLSPETARSIVETGDSLEQRFSLEPYASRYQSIRPNLVGVASRVDLGNQRIDSRLSKLLNQTIYGHLNLVVMKDGQTLYLQQGGVRQTTEEHVTLDYLINPMLKTRSRRIQRTHAKGFGAAPHSELAKRIRQQLQDERLLSGTNWERTFSQLLSDLVTTKRINPLMRLMMFENVLRVACQGSAPMRAAFESHLKRLDDAVAINRNRNWVMPQEPADFAAVSRAKEFFDTLPPVQQAGDQAKTLAEAPLQGALPELTWVGFLVPSIDETSWDLIGTPSGTAELQVIFRDRDLVTKIKRIGEYREGAIRWVRADQDAFVVGRPVFCSPQTER